MSKSYYECHITMLGDPVKLKPLVESTGWKFSCINGDPVLGDGIKCYATMLYNSRMNEIDVLNRLEGTADFLSRVKCEVIRRKVEKVIYDDRSDKVRWDCPCEDCHIDDMVQK